MLRRGVMAALLSLVLVAVSGILITDTHHLSNSTLYRLTQMLLQNYHKGVRPVQNWTQVTTVYLDLSVHAVLDVDAQNQKLKTSVWYQEIWNDEFLAWNSSMFDGIGEISLPLSAIWAPDIIINEFMDIEKSPDLPYVYVNSSGTIKNNKPIQVVSACSLKTYAFPFDTQNCSLTFNSILHTVADLDLAFLRSTEDIKKDKKTFMNDGEWELLSVPSTYQVMHSDAGDFAQIQFHVVIRRRPLAYVVNLLIPSIFLMVVDLGSFFLPPTCRTRITFKTSILVGYTVFKVNMSNEVPRSAVSTPLIGVFLTICMVFLVVSLSKSILLVKFLHTERSSRQDHPLFCFQRTSRARPVDGAHLTRTSLTVADSPTDVPPCHEHQPQVGFLEEALAQLQSISSCIQALDQAAQQEASWLTILYRFDKLLFQGYLLVLGVYTITLCSLWAVWSSL
ncbi:5-hydroxytryptamine receptor 3B [Phascolarctos cinereus]|uniref:5-hydroxytryptamine receptor 3B n=1 Tax=Phascolarctos cinereus TaxID=38626 RepID=A0A6P5KIS3_PHACI|nr:5-hydroxytryptamine receptor 3B [Phascolarctos cinereus]